MNDVQAVDLHDNMGGEGFGVLGDNAQVALPHVAEDSAVERHAQFCGAEGVAVECEVELVVEDFVDAVDVGVGVHRCGVEYGGEVVELSDAFAGLLFRPVVEDEEDGVGCQRWRW